MKLSVEERKAKAKAYATGYYLRIGKERRRQKRAQEGHIERSVSVWAVTWRPPCDTVPALRLGRAAWCVCAKGHEFIAIALPEQCPAIRCKKRMEWKGNYPQQTVAVSKTTG